MNRTDAPAKQSKPFGINGPREPILATTPSGDNTASYDQGFPPITMILKSAGGLPPKGQDMNQILYELSALSRWFSAGAQNAYDATFSAAIGGYPMGATILGNDGTTRYMSTVDSNTTNPNTGGAGWFNLTTGYLKTANNLSEIAAGGNTAIAAAISNLGLIGGNPSSGAGYTQNYFKIPISTSLGLVNKIIQYGTVNTTNGLDSILGLPIPFPTAVRTWYATCNYTASTGVINTAACNISTTTITIRASASVTVNWLAIGD
jgi:hypothetical protein